MRIQDSLFSPHFWQRGLLFALLIGGVLFTSQAQQTYKLVSQSGEPQGFAQMHVVTKGETLYGLARQYKVSVGEIKTWNGLQTDRIDIGQRLIIETNMAEAQTQSSTAGTTTADNGTNRGEAVSFESHLSDLFRNQAAPESQGWQSEEPDASEWSPFSTDMNSRGSTDQTSFTRKMRDDGMVAAETPSENAPLMRTKQVYYQVKTGDDIYSIADKYKIRVDEIRAWNALVDVVPGDVIVVGKRELSVPQNATSTNTTNTSTNRGLPARTRGASNTLDTRPQNQNTEQYRGETRNNQRIMRSDQSSLGSWMETGKYLPYEGEKYQNNRFYALHKTLPVGSTFKVLIPGNVGFFEVKVVGKLDAKADAIAALSFDSIRLLQGAGYQPELTIYYE